MYVYFTITISSVIKLSCLLLYANVLLYRNISRSADTPTAHNMQVYEQTISSINPVLFPLPLCSCALYGYINMLLHNLVQFMYPSQRKT